MNDLDENNVELYPVWKQALLKFLDAHFVPDQDIIPHEWFYTAFDIPMPTESTPLKIAEKAKLQWLGQFDKLKTALLERHQIDLKNVPGLGYCIVPPRDQSRMALEDMVVGMKKLIRNGMDRSINVDRALLSPDERRQDADTQARIGAFSMMFRRARTLPNLDEE